MRVTLAYPYDGHQPDDEIDLPDGEARRLVRDGKARSSEPVATTAPRPQPPAESTYRGPRAEESATNGPAAGTDEGAQE